MFETIPDYQDVGIILDQILWEVKIFTCIDELKLRLKAPDSLVIYEVYYFWMEAREDAKLDENTIIAEFQKVFSADDPGSVRLIHYGATNTMGGITDGAALFVCDKSSEKYELFGLTNTLDYTTSIMTSK